MVLFFSCSRLCLLGANVRKNCSRTRRTRILFGFSWKIVTYEFTTRRVGEKSCFEYSIPSYEFYTRRDRRYIIIIIIIIDQSSQPTNTRTISLPRFPLTAIGNSIDSNSIAPTSPNPMRKTQTITLPNDNSPGRQSVRHHSHASSHSRSSSIGTTIPPPLPPLYTSVLAFLWKTRARDGDVTRRLGRGDDEKDGSRGSKRDA